MGPYLTREMKKKQERTKKKMYPRTPVARGYTPLKYPTPTGSSSSSGSCFHFFFFLYERKRREEKGSTVVFCFHGVRKRKKKYRITASACQRVQGETCEEIYTVLRFSFIPFASRVGV